MRIHKVLVKSDAELIIVIMLALLALGTINVLSSGSITATTELENDSFFMIHQAGSVLAGLVVCFFMRRLDYRKFHQKWQGYIGFALILVVLALFYVWVDGEVAKGARRWIRLPVIDITVQPSEFAKIICMMAAANVIAFRLERGKIVTLCHRVFAFIFIAAGLIELEPDMGTAVIAGGVPFAMAFTVGIPRHQWMRSLVVGVIGCIAMVIYQPYRLERLKVMYDPWSAAEGAGYQTLQSIKTIGSGGLSGMGLGDGLSKYAYLPESHTDFAFAIFCQENGFIGALLIFILFGALIYLCTRVTRHAPDYFGQVLAIGITWLILGQALGNMIMVSGMFAVVGVPLPFISYGGSSLVTTMGCMGVLLSICDAGYRERQNRLSEKDDSSPREKQVPYLRVVK